MSESVRSVHPDRDADPSGHTRTRSRARSTTSPDRVGAGAGLEADANDGTLPADADADELLALLSDDYARCVLEAILDEALPAREIADRLDASRATVYRRLDRLESAGLVESSMSYDPDGHHRQRFRTTLDRVLLSFEDEGLVVEPST
jgi:DNA-binding transcriptional ArsR family regulator